MKRTLLLIWLLAAATGLGAQPLPMLYAPAGPREMALGGAGVALGADAWAAESNFAAAALSASTFAAGASYSLWAPGQQPDHRYAAGAWYRMNRVAAGLSVKGSVSAPYTAASNAGQVAGTYTPQDFAVAAAASFRLADGLSLGVTARYTASKLGESLSGSAFGADVSLCYAGPVLRAGLAVCNLGGSIRYGAGDAYAVPVRLRAALAAVLNALTFTAEAHWDAASGLSAAAGAEYRVLSPLALRAGYHFGSADRGLSSFASAGFALSILQGFCLEAAYLFASPTLGNSFCAGLSYTF